MNEGIYDKFTQGLKSGYTSARDETAVQYDKYSKIAGEAISKASGVAAKYSKKLGIPPELATALVASGLVGGPAAVPFAALMYFVKKPVNYVANKVFDAGWAAGEKVVGALKGGRQPQLQPESFSFKEWLMLMEEEEKEGFLDRFAKGTGHFIGRMAGNIAGLAGKVVGTMKSRLTDVYNYVTQNPKEVARAMFLVGVGALAGAAVGKITHDLKDMVVQKVKDIVQGVPAEEVAWLRKNIVLDPTEDGGYATHNYGSEEMLQQGDQNYMDVPYDSPDGTATSMVGGTAVKDTFTPSKFVDGEKKSMVDALTASHSGGKEGYFSTTQSHAKSLEDAYRDTAKQMAGISSQSSSGPWNPTLGKTTGMMPSLRGMNVNPEEMIARYGRSAADEIQSRLATPDTYTTPAAVAGATVNATNRRKK